MPRLEDLLIQTHLIGQPQLAIAQRDAEIRRKRLAPTIIDLGLVDDRRFAEWMAEVTRLPIVDPLPAEGAQALARRIPRAIAREYEVVPIALNAETLTVATINPLDIDCLNVLRTTTGLKIQPAIALYGALTAFVKRFYPEDDVESTILPDLNATMNLGTLDESAGSATRAIPPPPADPLERIEQHVREIAAAVARLERRLDAMDAALERILKS